MRTDLRSGEDLKTLCQSCEYSKMRKTTDNNIEIFCIGFHPRGARVTQRVEECTQYMKIGLPKVDNGVIRQAWFLRRVRTRKSNELKTEFIPPGHAAHPMYEGEEIEVSEVGY